MKLAREQQLQEFSRWLLAELAAAGLLPPEMLRLLGPGGLPTGSDVEWPLARTSPLAESGDQSPQSRALRAFCGIVG